MSKTTYKACKVFFVLLGVAALVLKRHYSGPFMEIFRSYSGNVSASFAVYFLGRILTTGWKYEKFVTAGVALLAVDLFEITNGFGIMTNVYDPVDYVANAVGVVLGLAVDTLVGLKWRNDLKRSSQ